MVTVAVSLFLAFSSASNNLEKSTRSTYDQLKFLDFYLSLRGVGSAALTQIQSIPGVKVAIGRRIVGARLILPGNNDDETSARVISVPVGVRPEVNDLFVHEGHYLAAPRGEALLERRYAAAHGLKLGDHIRLKQRYLEPQTFTIVGLVSSPEFIWLADDRLDPRPAARRLAIVYVSFADASTLAGEGDFNEIHVRLNPGASLKAVMAEAERRLLPDLSDKPVARSEQASHSLLMRDRAAFAGVAVLFPIIFLALATLTLLTTLWQLVVGQRKLIGVMMCQGIASSAIVGHYLFLCVTVAGVGGVLGLLVGQPLGVLCTRYYTDSLGLPLVVTAFYPQLCVVGLVVILTTAVLTGWAATYRLLGLEPAEVLRVEFMPVQRVPRLERVFPFLAHASYTFRLPMRNVMRHPLRNLGVICSLAFSVSILLMTLTFYDSERNTLEFFFTQVHHYDFQVDLVQPTSPAALPPFALWPGVKRAEFFLRQALKLRSGTGHEIERGVWGIPPHSQLVRIYDADRKLVEVTDNDVLLVGPLPLRSLGAHTGSHVRLWADTPQLHWRETTLVVGPNLFEPVSNPPKLTLARLQEIMAGNTNFPRDGVNIVLMQVDKEHQDHVRNALLASPYVAEVTDFGQFKDDIRTLLRLANAYFALMAVFSGLLAFALLVASSTMTVADRANEIATLAVLGFSEGTLASMLVVETLLLWLAAMVVGVPGGYVLGNSLLNHYQADLIQMQLDLSPWTILATTLGSLALCLAATVQSLGAVLKIPLSDATRTAS